MILKTKIMLLVIITFMMILKIFFRLFDTDESGNIELDEMFEIVATFYDMEVKIFLAPIVTWLQTYVNACYQKCHTFHTFYSTSNKTNQ